MKKRILCLALGLCLSLSGCAGVSSTLEKLALEQAGLFSDSDYLAYQAYNSEGKLNADGYYSEDSFEDDDIPAGSVLVSFSRNNNLDIRYFRDAEHTTEITEQAGYFHPGDCIYAAVEVSSDAASNMYAFTEFRLYQFKDGKRKLVGTVQPGSSGLILAIEDEMAGADLSVEPIGYYGVRELTFRDYYTDEEGNEHNLSGKWMIDEEEITGDVAQINPVASYIISYEFDHSEYFFMSSSPACHSSSNEDGIVIFSLKEAKDDSAGYSVQLHKYLSFSIDTFVERTVSMDGEEEKTLMPGTAFQISRLKYGDQMKLVTNKEWRQLEENRNLIITSRELNSEGRYVYSITVRQRGGEFAFDPSEYVYDHGKIIFECYGDTVDGIRYLAPGVTISYHADTIDDGYRLPDGEHTIIVGTEDETREALNSIRFIPITQATVSLPQPKYGGKIVYSANGREIRGNTFRTTNGTLVSMDFKPWPGWVSNFEDGATYRVTAAHNQVLTVQGQPVDTLFYEDPDHQPTLEVVLNKTVGTNTQVVIDTYCPIDGSDKDTLNCHYDGNWIGADMVVVDPAKTRIGTHKVIDISFKNKALQSGTAIKVLVEKQDSKGNKTSFYRLVNDLTKKHEPIRIYEPWELAASEVWYKSVRITISVVNAETFKAPQDPGNAAIAVRLTSTQRLMKTGDLIEPSSEVTVTITPDAGYYVAGKNVVNDSFRNTMKYSDYVKNIQNILDSHPAEKYIPLTLTASDACGISTYFLDNKPVSGSVLARQGQVLTIKYQVTATGYVIDGGSSGFLGLGRTDKEQSAALTLTSAWEGQTISRSCFGIKVVKGA